MSLKHNFSAGPAKLPEPVLERAQAELRDWQGRGISVMEISHRSEAFMALRHQAEGSLRALLAVPDDYDILFLQGGATLQFAMTALNLSTPEDTIDFAVTGSWGRKAIAEASRFASGHTAAKLDFDGLVPAVDSWSLSEHAAYCHYTPNETIDGVEFHVTPAMPEGTPLVGDFSSSILSRPIDVKQHALIYAGAQKNIGPAGLTVVILQRALMPAKREGIPELLNYQVHAQAQSLRNTPPTFAWYLAGLVFEWLQAQGGLAVMAQRNQEKAELLYRTLDASVFYTAPVPPLARSRMNVVFRLVDESLQERFLVEAESAGLVGLKGHRSIGGLRASLYNAVSLDSVQVLVDFLLDFESRYG
ncbi:MAG: 3-phosphoserine/phosphohydroxythreonine transaminase [Pseudomonadota bacterium]